MKNLAIFDTDVGTDDALGFAVWQRFVEVKPDYIVTGFGNTSLEGASLNAALLKKYLGMSAAVVKGAGALDLPSVMESGSFHGPDGMGGIRGHMEELLQLTDEEKTFADIETLKAALRQADHITYVAVGPLTTLEGLLEDADIKSRIDRILIMGGGFTEFNTSHDTEFNFSKNPVGVAKVLGSGIDITLFPLDLTNHQTVKEEEIDMLQGLGANPEFISLLRYNMKSNREFDHIDGAVLHDVMPILYLARPDDFCIEDKMVLVDEYGATKEDPSGCCIHVATKVTEGLLLSVLKEFFTA